MSVQKITEKQIGQKLTLMGKGTYMPVQNKLIKAVENLKLPTLEKQVDAVQAATNYLQ